MLKKSQVLDILVEEWLDLKIASIRVLIKEIAWELDRLT